MNHQKQMPVARGNEITLFDIWQILVARKWVILIAPVLTMVLAVLYLVQTGTVYECSAQILVGQICKEHPIANPAVLVQRLVEKYRVDDKMVTKGLPYISSVSSDKKNTASIVLLKAVDATAEGARRYLEQVVAEFLAEQHKLFEQELEIRHTRLQALSHRLEVVEAHQQELEKHIDKMGRQDPAQAAILVVEKGGFLTLTSGLEKERFNLQTEISAVDSYPTELLGVPYLPEKSIRPKRTLVLLLAGVSGLILGVTLAFVAEFITAARQRTQI
ncbi:MAG: Wzz/FepE/Etk N-terminal domain-containing protein [Desulfobulbus sp.]|jgi:LPS O-antigen subunit length determinant protein (WzzB/FepE family)|nr:Wzz/FepE/Etk N-terminal domain-containing protein [Desulfobulbus sp.]